MTDVAAAFADIGTESSSGHESAWPLEHVTLAGLHWPARPDAANQRPMLLLHGWLDNSDTFAHLAPELTSLGNVHAFDFAGHGHSGHRPPGQHYVLMDYVADLAELIELHFDADKTPLDLVGHSLGGIVAALYAAAFPERVRKLVLIDSLGALSRHEHEVIPQLRRSITKRLAGSGKPALYPDLATAAKVRAGGLSPLSPEAALALIPRNMQPVENGWLWRTDARLRHPSALMLSEQQVLASLAALSTPTLFVRAQSGILADNGDTTQARAQMIKDFQQVDVPGGHHCHLDGDTRPVTKAVKRFLNQ